MNRHAKRCDKLRRALCKAGIPALLVTNVSNVTYLTGFTGDDSFLLITESDAVVISDFRYETQLQQECPDLDLEIRGTGVKLIESVGKVAGKAKLSKLGIEAQSLSVAVCGELEEQLSGVELVSTHGLVEELRCVKDREEVDALRRAVRQAQKAFGVVREWLTPDVTEKQVAAELENQLRRFGAAGVSFDPIVASGPRSALPHATPTAEPLGATEFTLFDWGAKEGLYRSDLTRLVVTGKISPKLQRIYGVVLKANAAGIEAVRPGATCEEVDHAARAVISKAGYDKQFGHSLGHGIGLDIHEAPRLAQNQDKKLKAGMVVTIEPGIYLPGWGGVRIEDDVLVTRGGCEVLSSVPKELEQCVVE